jgi:type IV secretory pathway component VirB8
LEESKRVRRYNLENYQFDLKPKIKRNIKNKKENSQKDSEILPVNLKNTTKIHNEKVNIKNISKKCKSIFIAILFITSFLVIAGIIIIINFLFKPKKRKPNEINFKNDKLIIQKNILLIYI